MYTKQIIFIGLEEEVRTTNLNCSISKKPHFAGEKKYVFSEWAINLIFNAQDLLQQVKATLILGKVQTNVSEKWLQFNSMYVAIMAK